MAKRPNIKNLLFEYLLFSRKMDTNYAIARTMFEHADELGAMKLEVLARMAGTTGPTVTKFCRQLGYQGYQDLREPPEDVEVIAEPRSMPVGENHLATVSSWIDSESAIMRTLAKAYDREQVLQVARRIADARGVTVVTGFYAAHATELFEEQLRGTGVTMLPVSRSAEWTLVHDAIAKSDVALVVSLTGGWYQEHLGQLEDVASRIVLVTDAEVEGCESLLLASTADFFSSMQITHGALIMLFTTLAAMVHEMRGAATG